VVAVAAAVAGPDGSGRHKDGLRVAATFPRVSLHEIHAHENAPRSNSTRTSGRGSSLYEIYAHGGPDGEVYRASVSYGNFF